MLTAEAGYEEAVFWMSQQDDLAYVMQAGGNHTASFTVTGGQCAYEVSFFGWLNHRPAYRVLCQGSSGQFGRIVDVVVLQEIGGWDMGRCVVPTGVSSTTWVYFADNEVIDMPIHINELDDSPDERDIAISGSPRFLQEVSMGEPRHTSGGSDKYGSVLGVFEYGIAFDQPNSRVTNTTSVDRKLIRLHDSTAGAYIFTPSGGASIPNAKDAVQLEFFVAGGVGKVRITDNCTVRGFHQSSDSRTWDFKVQAGSGGTAFERYDIYAYHLIPTNAESTGDRVTHNVEDTYVQQVISGMASDPGGQIYVNGDVIIGGQSSTHQNTQVVKGKITVVATGNIWVGDTITVDGNHDASGMPADDNPNALGLVAKGVVKVVDPGMSDYSYVDGSPTVPGGYEYAPIGYPDSGYGDYSHKRSLPDPLVVEAAITVGGGGWGAENVSRGSYGGRKEGGTTDDLVVRGAIAEVVRGVVGLIGNDGYVKHYYFDRRLREGILPGDVWLKSKFVPAPAGWHDYRVAQGN